MGQLLNSLEYFGDSLDMLSLAILRYQNCILILRLSYFKRLVDLRDFILCLVIARSIKRSQNSEKDQCCLLRITEVSLVGLLDHLIDFEDFTDPLELRGVIA